jgi:hypothetical protein
MISFSLPIATSFLEILHAGANAQEGCNWHATEMAWEKPKVRSSDKLHEQQDCCPAVAVATRCLGNRVKLVDRGVGAEVARWLLCDSGKTARDYSKG